MTALFIIGVTSQLLLIPHHPGRERKNDKDESEERNHFDVDNPKELTHISLCAGYGGIDLGLKRVLPNLRTVAFSEIEAYAVANLVAKMEEGLLDAAPIWTNLKTFPWEDFRGKVDLLSGGFPCQPFSVAGRKRGDEDPRHLFPYIKRGIALVRPSIIFLENVEGIISSKLGEGWNDRAGTSVLLHVLRELERLGYKATAGIFSASEIGAPHQRKRVFIMAYSNQGGSSEKRMDISSTGSPEYSSQGRRIWPSRRGEYQKEWEPKRVIIKKLDNSKHRALQDSRDVRSSDQKQNSSKETRMSFDARLSNTTLVDSNKSRLEGDLFKEQPKQKISKSPSRSSASRNIPRTVESSLGRDVDGCSDWMDYGDLCESVCNRTDELRLLGNGVVPATAERAFRVLWEKIKKDSN